VRLILFKDLTDVPLIDKKITHGAIYSKITPVIPRKAIIRDRNMPWHEKTAYKQRGHARAGE